jgi:hypothetical protein
MKKSLSVILTAVFVLALFSFPVYAKKAGKIKDDVYTDSEHGFSLKIPVGWSASVKKAKRPLRLSLDQKSPVEPQQFRGELRDYMQIPSIKILVDTCSVTSEQFFKNLQDPKYSSKQKDFFLKYMRILKGRYEILKSKDMTISGEKATLIEVRLPYEVEVSKRGTDRADVINDNKTGSILLSCRDGKVYMIHMICEYQTSAQILEMFNVMINSLKFE